MSSSNQPKQIKSLINLPNELGYNIAQYLTGFDRIACSFACRKTYQFVNRQEFQQGRAPPPQTLDWKFYPLNGYICTCGGGGEMKIGRDEKHSELQMTTFADYASSPNVCHTANFENEKLRYAIYHHQEKPSFGEFACSYVTRFFQEMSRDLIILFKKCPWLLTTISAAHTKCFICSKPSRTPASDYFKSTTPYVYSEDEQLMRMMTCSLRCEMATMMATWCPHCEKPETLQPIPLTKFWAKSQFATHTTPDNWANEKSLAWKEMVPKLQREAILARKFNQGSTQPGESILIPPYANVDVTNRPEAPYSNLVVEHPAYKTTEMQRTYFLEMGLPAYCVKIGRPVRFSEEEEEEAYQHFLRQTGESDMRGKGYRWAPTPKMVEVVESVDFEMPAEEEADDEDVDEEADDNEPEDQSAENGDTQSDPVDVMAQTLQSLAIAACEEVDAAEREPGMSLRPVED